MLNKNTFRKALASCLLVAVWGVSSMVTLANVGGDKNALASINVAGNVTVDGKATVSNGTIVSGSTIKTGETEDSVATVDLGKLGRIQLLSQSTLVLKFDDAGIYGTLLVGKVRVMNMDGVTTTVTTQEGMVVGDNAQANTFVVETECGRTAVNTEIGSAVLRAEGQDRQIAAGSEAVAGSLSQTGCRPCLRPFPGKPFPVAKFLPFLIPVFIGAGVLGIVRGGSGNGSGIVPIGGGFITPTR